MHLKGKKILVFEPKIDGEEGFQLGVFTKPHKPHKSQKPHQNRPQNGITTPHGTMRFAIL